MKLWIFSDLHLEFERIRPSIERVPEADVWVVPGDVLNGCANSIHWLAVEMAPRMPVVFVAGNHEFYGDSVMEGIEWGRTAADGFPDVHFLERDSVEIGGVRFLGTIMWTDYQLDGEGRSEHAFSMAVAEGRLMDHRQIAWRQLPRYESFTPLHALNEHERSREWLKGGFGKPFDGPTVVVTHHGPHPNSVHWRWKGSALNPAFSSDLTGLFWLGKPAL